MINNSFFDILKSQLFMKKSKELVLFVKFQVTKTMYLTFAPIISFYIMSIYIAQICHGH